MLMTTALQQRTCAALKLIIGVSYLLSVLLGTSLSTPARGADCTSGFGCKDCGIFPNNGGTIECATVSRDAFCSCQSISNGCQLAGVCDYTGSSQECQTTPEGGECPFVKNSIPRRKPGGATKLLELDPALAPTAGQPRTRARLPEPKSDEPPGD